MNVGLRVFLVLMAPIGVVSSWFIADSKVLHVTDGPTREESSVRTPNHRVGESRQRESSKASSTSIGPEVFPRIDGPTPPRPSQPSSPSLDDHDLAISGHLRAVEERIARSEAALEGFDRHPDFVNRAQEPATRLDSLRRAQLEVNIDRDERLAQYLRRRVGP